MIMLKVVTKSNSASIEMEKELEVHLLKKKREIKSIHENR